MALTDIMIRNAKPKDKHYKLSDSGGLYVLVKTNGTKCWRLKYRIAGKENALAIGIYPVVTLSAARDKAMKAKEQLTNNLDPSQVKKEEKLKHIVDAESSFEAVARCWHSNNLQKWTPRHASYVIRRLNSDIFPFLGCKHVGDIKAPELLLVLRKIEARDAIDIAHRALQTCGQIFRYAVATGRAERHIN